MQLLTSNHQETWDRFVSSQPGAQFTQSFAWGTFRESLGIKTTRYVLAENDGTWVAAAQVFYHAKGPLLGYVYAPRGPVIRHDALDRATDLLSAFLDVLRAQASIDKRAVFLRIEPPLERKRDPSPLPASCVRAHAYQPASTLMIDLSNGEQELLDDMHEKTRYNIRVAERKGVIVRASTTSEDLDLFLRMNEETAKRDRFVSQSSAYIRQTVLALKSNGMAQVRLAEKDGKPLAASIEIQYGDTVTYLYGASSSSERNAMAPYALHWDAIRSAKRDGFRFYDLHGINPEEKTSPYYKSSWEGITRFKLGWGGSRIDLVGTWELPLRPFVYAIMRFLGQR